ncbi:response regulator [Sediminicola sp. 1XM1-17]|uniref:response regulator n=1 Tax=Sediminicola sp. 1XM1-17 TaxID=3127702 RepID=UPI0030777FFC
MNKIVLVDDDPIIQFVNLRILRKYTSQGVVQLENGAEALAYFQGAEGAAVSHLVLLDINMPVMDGWEFLDAVYQHGLEGRMSVIVLTSSVDILDMEKSKNYGNIIHFVQKPLTADKVDKIPMLMEYLEQA